jgi:pimeloyl-ACP methyl ester carboxylesterase
MPFAVAGDGTRIAYEVFGRGAPLLLISGQSLDRTMWDGVRPALAAEFRVIVFDARGTGASDKPHTPYSTRGFAADAAAVLDAAGIARAHIYGFSMGGRVAQWLAIDHPERVGALVLGATTPGGAHSLPKPADIDAALLPSRHRRSRRTHGVCILPPAKGMMPGPISHPSPRRR